MGALRQVMSRFAKGAGGAGGRGAPRGGYAGPGARRRGAGRGSTKARVGVMAQKFLRRR